MRFICPICDQLMYEIKEDEDVPIPIPPRRADGPKDKRKLFAVPTIKKPPFLSCELGQRASHRHLHRFRFDLNTEKCHRPRSLFRELEPKSIVATKCGHVFHKECIYKYMRAYRIQFRESSVECPVCTGRVLCAGTFPLDLKASEECCQQADHNVKVLRLLRNEMLEQTEAVAKKILAIEEQIEKATDHLAILEELKYKRYSTAYSQSQLEDSASAKGEDDEDTEIEVTDG